MSLRDLLAWAGLAIATLATLWPLGLTNRVLAGVDAFTYFTPYWAERMAALRGGHLPLWNPDLFLGAPFLANIQAAVLYPLHWPLSWLSPAAALIWSALLHVWLAAGFTYTFARRSLRLSRPAAWLAGLIFGLGGFTLARVENINQLNALAWLPALLWLLDKTARAGSWRSRVRWGMALTVVIALQLLAGHTQTAFVNLVGLGLYALYPGGRAGYGKLVDWYSGKLVDWYIGRFGPGQSGQDTKLPTYQSTKLPAYQSTKSPPLAHLLPLAAILPALLLAAAQLLPSIELNGLGLRTGGLPYRQAVSFSLRPRLLAQSLLPPFGGGLAEAFASEGYAEFVGYVGIVGLALAAIGIVSLWRRRRRRDPEEPVEAELPLPTTQSLIPNPQSPIPNPQSGRLLLLVAIGLFLALGAYNPLYYMLWRVVPGFDWFRAPARWLALYALGVAGLAGVGLDAWFWGTGVRGQEAGVRRQGSGDRGQETGSGGQRQTQHEPIDKTQIRNPKSEIRNPTSRRRRVTAALVLLAMIALAALQQWPRWPTLIGWAAVGCLAVALLWAGRRGLKPARGGLIALALVELWLAGRALPFNQATAPLALSLRNAPATLLAATADQPPAGRDRFLSMSDIRFDPGDLAELRALQADRLGPAAVERLVRAAKQVEVIAPNLPMLFDLPAIDGYDGGMLPLKRYVELQSLFLPPEKLLPDGRLREQLRQIPDGRLLDLTGVRYVITDKQNDLWVDDVYYDLEQAVLLRPDETLTLDLADYPPFSATALGVVSYLAHPLDDGWPVAYITLTDVHDIGFILGMGAPGDTAWYKETRTGPGMTVARQWPDWMGEGHDYLGIHSFDTMECRGLLKLLPQVGAPIECPRTVRTLKIKALPNPGAPLVIRGLSLIDERTGAHQSITLSPRGDLRRIHSGDVKIYERTTAPGRAWLVHGVEPVADDAAALTRLADPAFDPRATVAITGDVPAQPAGQATAAEGVIVLAYEAERVVLRVTCDTPATLVLADAAYPGWQVTVDAAPAPILLANLMFRGVTLGPGVHEVTFTYRPAIWRWGVVISLGTLVALLIGFCATLRMRRKYPRHEAPGTSKRP